MNKNQGGGGANRIDPNVVIERVGRWDPIMQNEIKEPSLLSTAQIDCTDSRDFAAE